MVMGNLAYKTENITNAYIYTFNWQLRYYLHVLSLMLVNKGTNINQAINHFSPLIIEEKQNTKRTTTYAISNPGMSWVRYRNVTKLNWLMKSSPS
jgi:hypothetical protein